MGGKRNIRHQLNRPSKMIFQGFSLQESIPVQRINTKESIVFTSTLTHNSAFSGIDPALVQSLQKETNRRLGHYKEPNQLGPKSVVNPVGPLCIGVENQLKVSEEDGVLLKCAPNDQRVV